MCVKKALYWVERKFKPVLLCFVTIATVLLLCSVALNYTAFAATASVDTVAELQTACQTSGTVTITSPITITETITIPQNATVYLTCSHAAGSSATDLSRAKDFHGHLFDVKSGGMLYVRCCIDGGCRDSSGNLKGFASDSVETSGYYGNALIVNRGTVVLDSDKSILRNNYNPDDETSTNGAGVWNAGTFKMSNGVIGGNVSTGYGGGIYNEGTLNITKGVIESNTAYSVSGNMIGGCGGGLYSSKSFSLSAGVVVKNNTSANGGGIYVDTDWDAATEDVSLFTLDGAEIIENIALDGGGVTVAHSNMVMKSGTVSRNKAGQIGDRISTGSGGGIDISGNRNGDGSIDRGILTISGGTISNNTVVSSGSADGGGIYGHRALINMSGGTITGNTCTPIETEYGKGYGNGGGVFLNERTLLNMTGGVISKNYAEYGGGVGLIYYYDSTAILDGNALVTENTAYVGGGIYNGNCGWVNDDGTIDLGVKVKGNSSVQKNTATYGGGIASEGGVVIVEGGNIRNNTGTYGGGVFIFEQATLFLTSNSIYSNTAEDGVGVYVSGPGEYTDACTFYMSDAACVGDTNRDGMSDSDDVYLEAGTYISVPSRFTYNATDSAITTGVKALRALVTPDTDATGRVIAKYTTDTTADGSVALYWNDTAPRMSEQHFRVKNKVVRAGDQGAASVAATGVSNHDVFISEAYFITFEGNLPGYTVTVPKSITKYWHEALTNITFENASTTSTAHVFLSWNAQADGSGATYSSPMNYSVNANLVLYAQWFTDDPPTITAIDRWFTLAEAKSSVITLQELMRTAKAVDGTEGDFTDFSKGEGTFTIIDFDAAEFARFTTSGSVTVTYCAIDKAENVAYRTVVVHIIDKDQDVGTLGGRLIRFISSKYFKDKNGDFVEESAGGLHAASVWVTNPNHTTLLTNTLVNNQVDDTGEWDTVYQTWTFTPEQIAEVQEYIDTNGLGNEKNDDALMNFYNKYKPQA